MRQKFLFLIVMIIVTSLVVGAIYLLLRSLLDVFDDWRTDKEMKDLSEESSQRRESREREHQERLKNGCEHQWAGSLIGFPPNVCCRCGLEKELPLGPCDHLWRAKMDEVPIAVCEHCGEEYRRPQTTV